MGIGDVRYWWWRRQRKQRALKVIRADIRAVFDANGRAVKATWYDPDRRLVWQGLDELERELVGRIVSQGYCGGLELNDILGDNRDLFTLRPDLKEAVAFDWVPF